jgi:hypothetical protein
MLHASNLSEVAPSAALSNAASRVSNSLSSTDFIKLFTMALKLSPSLGKIPPLDTPAITIARALLASVKVSSFGSLNEQGRSRTGGRIRSRHSRKATVSPVKAKSMALRVNCCVSPSIKDSANRLALCREPRAAPRGFPDSPGRQRCGCFAFGSALSSGFAAGSSLFSMLSTHFIAVRSSHVKHTTPPTLPYNKYAPSPRGGASRIYFGPVHVGAAGDLKGANALKALSTTTMKGLETKNLPVVTCPVGVNLWLASNSDAPVHIEEEDARYWTLKINESRIGATAYFEAIIDEIKHGGREAFAHFLLNLDVSKFVPKRDVPRDNADRRKIIKECLNPYETRRGAPPPVLIFRASA